MTEYIIVTRHELVARYIKAKGIAPEDTEVIPYASANDVLGKHVVGIIPIELAALADAYTEVRPSNVPKDKHMDSLTFEEMSYYIKTPQTYVVYKDGEEPK